MVGSGDLTGLSGVPGEPPAEHLAAPMPVRVRRFCGRVLPRGEVRQRCRRHRRSVPCRGRSRPSAPARRHPHAHGRTPRLEPSGSSGTPVAVLKMRTAGAARGAERPARRIVPGPAATSSRVQTEGIGPSPPVGPSCPYPFVFRTATIIPALEGRCGIDRCHGQSLRRGTPCFRTEGRWLASFSLRS